MNIKKILQNASYLFIGNISIRLLTAISTILLARNIGPEAYGIFSIAIAISTIAGYFTDAGLSNTFMREVTKKGADFSELISSYLRVRIAFGIFASVLSYLFINFFYQDDPYLIAIISWILYPTIIGMTFMGVGISYFQAKERMGLSTLINIIQGVICSSAVVMGIIMNYPLIVVSKIYGASFVIAGIFSILIISRHTSLHRGWNKLILDKLFVFTINGIIVIILPQLGPIILEKVSTLTDVGYFATAYKIPAVLYQLPGVIATAFYPRLFKYGNELDYKKHSDLSQLELKIMSFIGMWIAIPFIVDPEFWIVNLLGEEWLKVSNALSILSFMVILQSINYPLGDYLTTKNEQSKRTIVMTIGVAVSLISYVILGGNYGLTGGAFSAIITELTMLIGYGIYIRGSISLLIKSVKYNIISLVICIILYDFLSNLISLLSILIISVLYAVLVLILDRESYRKIKLLIIDKFR